MYLDCYKVMVEIKMYILHKLIVLRSMWQVTIYKLFNKNIE